MVVRMTVHVDLRHGFVRVCRADIAQDMDIIAAGIYSRRYDRWSKRAQQSTHKATQSMKRALDASLLKASFAYMSEAIRRFRFQDTSNSGAIHMTTLRAQFRSMRSPLSHILLVVRC